MFKVNEHCRPPPDDTVIWRYFDLAKFLSLVDQKALFFTSASHLEDDFEGAWPMGQPPEENEEDDARRRKIRDLILISSWHINSSESFAMWKLYSQSREAIAIRSTIGRLKACFNANQQQDVLIGKVQYMDYREECLTEPHYLAPYLRKAKPFSYENEVRAILDLYDRWNHEPRKKPHWLAAALQEHGVYVQADLGTLIEEIHIAPTAERWFLDLVRGLLPKFGLPIQPRQSVLADRPVY